jgi:hypothetical protein
MPVRLGPDPYSGAIQLFFSLLSPTLHPQNQRIHPVPVNGDLSSSNSEPQPSSSGQYKWQKKMLIEVEHLSKEEREGERLGSAGA